MAGLTLEQLQKMGGKPVQSSGGLTLQQLQQMGATPAGVTPQTKEPGFLQNLITDPIKTLLVRPAIRTGQAVAGIGVNLFGSPETKARFQEALNQPVNFAGMTIEPQKGFDEGGGKQILGEAAQTASYLYTGGGAPAVIGSGLKGQVLSSALQGTKVGAIGGGLYSFGDAIQEADVQPSDIAYKTLFGATLGGVTGGALGAITPIVVKGVDFTKKFTDVNQINTELNKLNNQVFRPTAKQSEKFSVQGKDPIKTYTDIFGAEIPQVDKNNRFTNESINDFIEKVDDVYKPAAEGFNTILRNSPEVNSITKAEKDAIKNLDMFNLTPSQKQKALQKIKDEFIAIRNESLQKGLLKGDNIPVSYTDNLKDRFWGQTRNFGTEDATISNSVNSSIGHGFKDAIENVIKDVNVKNYNKQLGDLIVLRDYLDTKRGALSGTGGKMTRLMARVVGSVAGAKGGPIGSIIGNLTGDKLAQIMIDPSLQPYRWLIKKEIQKLPKAQVLQLEKEANTVLEKMFQRRMETLALPAPATSLAPKGKIGTPIPSVIESRGATTFEAPAQKIGYQPLIKSESQLPITKPIKTVKTSPISKTISQPKVESIGIEKQLSKKYPDISFNIYESADKIEVPAIVVKKELRGSGLGTSAMNDLTKYADQTNKTIELTPSTDFGGSSVSRLKDFYKRFGFVENSGKNKDFSTRQSMYRKPKLKVEDTSFNKTNSNLKLESTLLSEVKKYKSAEEFVKAKTGAKLEVGETFDETLGRSIDFKIGNANVRTNIRETVNEIFLNTIGTRKLTNSLEELSGTGSGTNIINKLKEYADLTGKKLIIPDATNKALPFWEKFKWLQRDFRVKVPLDGKQYNPPNTFSYTPKI